MKYFITTSLWIILSGIISISYGQWPMQIIDSGINNPAIVEVGDIDGDGDLDAAATSFSGSAVLWYENASPNWYEYSVGTLSGAVGVNIADIDGDSLMDVVAAGNSANQVVWYKNGGGTPITWTEYHIADLMSAETAETVDIDDDGDLDVIVTGVTSNRVVFYKNMGGTPVSWETVTIDANLGGAMCTDFGDIDRDNDLDVIATGRNANDVVWYENPSWTKYTIDPNLVGAWGVRVGDFDDDDTLDVAAAGIDADQVVWYKNSHAGQTWTKYPIDTNLNGAMCLFLGDINLDSKLDVVATGRYDNKVFCYTNDLPTWSVETIDDNLAWANYVSLADFDDDTDLDVFVTGWNANQVVLYVNPVVGIKAFSDVAPASLELSQNYPNPFNPTTAIEFSIPKSELVTLKIYNTLGEEVSTLVSDRLSVGSYQYEWNASGLASGVYLYRLQAGEYGETRKMILMK
ncbi:MAG: T9SS type A sorting domain-containing protein [bacterium]|nr:MAG: T9SS type A sorting domain-containing protein [bacterium]